MIGGRCVTCKWYSPTTTTQGECHVNAPESPPQVKKSGKTEEVFAVWPTVQTDGWCGQYKADEQAKIA